MVKSVNGILLVLATVLLVPLVSYSAGLGKLTVKSALGQPLDAEIEVIALQPGEDLKVRLASREAYRDAGVDLSPALQGARFAVERRDGRTVIRVTTTQPINDPFMTVMVELQGRSGKLARQYTVLVDPVEYRTATTVAPALAAQPAVAPPVAAASAPAVAPVTAIPAPTAAPARPLATAPAPAPVLATSVAPAPAQQSLPPAAVATAPAPIAPAQAVAAKPAAAPAQPAVAAPAAELAPSQSAAAAPAPAIAPSAQPVVAVTTAAAPAQSSAVETAPARAAVGTQLKATEVAPSVTTGIAATRSEPPAAPPAAASATPEPVSTPVVVAPAPVQSTRVAEAATVPSSTPAAASTQAESARTAPVPAAQTGLTVTASVAPTAQSPLQTAAPSASPAPAQRATDVSDTYRIKRGDTLGGIARKWKPDGVTLQQMLMGLYQINRPVFIRDNINLIRAGATLFMPGRDDVLAINATDAARQVRTHMAAFSRYRDTAMSAGSGSGRISQAQREAISRRVGVKRSTRAM